MSRQKFEAERRFSGESHLPPPAESPLGFQSWQWHGGWESLVHPAEHPYLRCSGNVPNLVTDVGQLPPVTFLTHLLGGPGCLSSGPSFLWAVPMRWFGQPVWGLSSHPLGFLRQPENKPSPPCDAGGKSHPFLSAEPRRLPCVLSNYQPPPAQLLYYSPSTSLHTLQVASSGFMTVYPEPVWIMHAIIQLGSEPRAFYKIKQAPANSAILQAQTTPSPTRSRMLLFSPWWVGASEWSPQQLHLTSYLFSLACTPAFGTPFMRISVTLLTRVPSAARPLRGGPGPPSLCAQPFHNLNLLHLWQLSHALVPTPF